MVQAERAAPCTPAKAGDRRFPRQAYGWDRGGDCACAGDVSADKNAGRESGSREEAGVLCGEKSRRIRVLRSYAGKLPKTFLVDG